MLGPDRFAELAIVVTSKMLGLQVPNGVRSDTRTFEGSKHEYRDARSSHLGERAFFFIESRMKLERMIEIPQQSQSSIYTR